MKLTRKGRLDKPRFDTQRARARRDAWLIAGMQVSIAIVVISMAFFPVTALCLCLASLDNAQKDIICASQMIGFFGMAGVLFPLLVISNNRRDTTTIEPNVSDINMIIYGTNRFLYFQKTQHHYTTEEFRGQRNALVRVLPAFQEADSGLLSARSHRTFDKCLQEQDNELTLAILEALPRIGIRASLPHVEKLAMGYGAVVGNEAVQQAAIVCLVSLKNRFAEQDTRTLLRASAAEQRGDQLLRPARANTLDASETLLRASQTIDPNTPEPVRCSQGTAEELEQTCLHHI